MFPYVVRRCSPDFLVMLIQFTMIKFYDVIDCHYFRSTQYLLIGSVVYSFKISYFIVIYLCCLFSITWCVLKLGTDVRILSGFHVKINLKTEMRLKSETYKKITVLNIQEKSRYFVIRPRKFSFLCGQFSFYLIHFKFFSFLFFSSFFFLFFFIFYFFL